MLVRVYALAWLVLIAVAGGLLAMVGATELVLTALGFAFSTLLFAGLVAVLPWLMDKHYSRYMLPEQKPDARNRGQVSKVKNGSSKKAPAMLATPLGSAI